MKAGISSSTTEAIPFVASAAFTSKILPGQLCSIVFSGFEPDEPSNFALLPRYDLAFCERHP